MRKVTIDLENNCVLVEGDQGAEELPMASPEAFKAVSDAWIRVGWDTKHVYTFSWLGRPMIQLPEDMVRLQEVIWAVKPTVIIETGIAHGGGLVFYASLLKAMGGVRRVVGVDIQIRQHNRVAIESHELSKMITLIEGSSIDPEVVEQVRALIGPDDRVLVALDANHTKEHVLAELAAYGPMVTADSYIVAMDGIMERVCGAPRTEPDWRWNNPKQAALEFVAAHPAEFAIHTPPFSFCESQLSEAITYWPCGYLRRLG